MTFARKQLRKPAFAARLVRPLAALLASAALLLPLAAQADPVEVQSENIVFYGDVDPALAEARVREWEIYRRVIFLLSGVMDPPPDGEKLTIYGFEKTRTLQEFVDRNGLRGVYTRGNQGPIFLTSVNDRKYRSSQEVGLHEYAHHVLEVIVREGFPRWYDEGFANYLSTMDISDGMVTLGDPSNDHMAALRRKQAKFLSPETVLSSNTLYPRYTRREWEKGGPMAFYGQASLYVHYLFSHPEWNAKLPGYLAKLEAGVPPLDAFEQAYGESPRDFHNRAVRYFKADEFILNRYKLGEQVTEVDTTVRALSESDLARAMIPARMRFLHDGNRGRFKRQLDTAAQEHDNDLQVMMGYAFLHIHDEDYAAARAQGEAMMAIAPDDHDARRTLADALYHADIDTGKNSFKPAEPTENVETAIGHWKAILADNPLDYDALTHVLQYYGSNGEPADATVQRAAATMDARFMDTFFPTKGLNIAVVYAKAGRVEDACNYYEQARFETKGKKWKWMDSKLDWFEGEYGAACEGDDS